jgi:hypothetical protein
VLTNNASEGLIQLWRAPQRQASDAEIVPGRAAELRQYVWDSGAAACAAFAPDAPFAVTGTRDNAVLVWALPPRDANGELIEKPAQAKLTLVEESLDSSARQVRVWAELPNEEARTPCKGLNPGGTATVVVPLGGGKEPTGGK